MKQILVIDNAEWWISLNREFAGRDDLRISETPTWDSGVRLAMVESLELVICTCDEARPTPGDLEAALVRCGVDLERVICVGERDPSSATIGGSKSKLLTCSSDQLVATVREFLAPPINTGPVEIDLLAQCQFEANQPGEAVKGFVNLTQIDSESIYFESSGSLHIGDVISMRFVLPRSISLNAPSKRISIELKCKICSCNNLEKFSYRAEITEIQNENAKSLKHFVSTRIPKLES